MDVHGKVSENRGWKGVFYRALLNMDTSVHERMLVTSSHERLHGVFISIPENDDPEAFAKFPKDLQILLRYAWKNDAKLVRLDMNAEIDEILPVYKNK